MSTKSFYGIGQGSFYGGGMYGNGQPSVGFIEKTIGPASIISFNDGAKNKPLKECVVDIEPVQDLHGYDSPWPAGGGKNKAKFAQNILDVDRTQSGITFHALNENTVRISGESTGNAFLTNAQSFEKLVSEKRYYPAGTYTMSSNLPIGQSPGSYVYMTGFEEDGSAISGNIVTGVYADNPVTFTREAGFYANVQICIRAGNDYSSPIDVWVQIEEGSAATEWTPYANISPITGWTGAKVTRCGKNLCNKTFEHSVYSVSNGVKYSHEGSESKYISFGIVPVKSGTTYAISWMDDENNPCTTGTVIFYRGNTFLGYVSLNNVTRHFTVPENADGVAVNLLSQNKITSISQIDISNPQIELGSTATDYESYQGETYDITFPSEAGTVYGGTLDVTKGILTVDRAMKDMGTLNWSMDPNRSGVFYATITGKKVGGSPINMCSIYQIRNIHVSTSYDKYISGMNSYGNGVFVRDTTYANANDFKASVNGQTVVYSIATSVVYQLTPQQIKTLLGTNNIWADTGDINEIKYLKKVEYETKTTSGNPIHINDGMNAPAKKLNLSIEPVQDLHGYDAPWPAGSGVNKFVAGDAIGVIAGAAFGLSVVCDGTAETITISGTPNYTSASTEKSFRVISTRSGSYFGDAPVDHDYSGLSGKWFVVSKSSNISNVREGAGINEDGTIAVTLINTDLGDVNIVLKLVLYEGSTAPTLWTPYSNICPITGWTGAKVTRTGKNLIPYNLQYYSSSDNLGFTKAIYLKQGNYILSFGETTATNWRYFIKSFNADGTIRTNGTDITSASLNWRAEQNGYLNGSNGTSKSIYFAVNVDAYYAFCIRFGTNADTTYSSCQLELGSTATAYEPYQGEIYDIAFPPEAGTVYGGTLDVTSGVLTVDRVMVTKNTADMNNSESYPGWKNAGIKALVGAELDIGIKSMLNIGTRFNVNTRASNDTLFLSMVTYRKTQTEWIAEAIDVQIVVPLATPATYQLTPTEINLLLEENYIYTDINNIDLLKYKGYK